MLTIGCVLSEGPKRTYNKSHVDRLESMVAKHLKQPYQFVCIEDSPFPGWWAKINLFQPDRFQGRILYLDLDVTVTGNIDDLANYPGSFVICRDWASLSVFNSSVMSWDAGTADNIYNDFLPVSDSVMSMLHGDQDYITMKKPDAVKFPRDWCWSYRLGQRTGYPKDMRVCVYHGFPKPWEVT